MIKLLRIASTAYNSLNQLVVKVRGAKAAYTAEQYAPFGTDARPPKDMTAIYGRTEADGDDFVIAYLHKDLVAEIGEHRIFSTDADLAHKFSVWLRADGTLLMGTSKVPGDYTNFAVKFNELKEEFDKLKADHNDLVSKYNSHTHVTTCGAGLGSAAATTTQDSPNTSNIDNCKNSAIKYN